MEKILIFDNYDSFTYNIVHLVNSLGYDADVYRNDRISIEQAGAYERMIISPGPGLPCESGILPDVLRRSAPHKRLLGICLGHQPIGECFGAHLENLPHVYHGVATPVKVIGQDPIFDGLGGEFTVGRYHSWVVSDEDFPSCLNVTARDGNGQIMALAHRRYDVRGVQFHPESILTPQGHILMKNWLSMPRP